MCKPRSPKAFLNRGTTNVVTREGGGAGGQFIEWDDEMTTMMGEREGEGESNKPYSPQGGFLLVYLLSNPRKSHEPARAMQNPTYICPMGGRRHTERGVATPSVSRPLCLSVSWDVYPHPSVLGPYRLISLTTIPWFPPSIFPHVWDGSAPAEKGRPCTHFFRHSLPRPNPTNYKHPACSGAFEARGQGRVEGNKIK